MDAGATLDTFFLIDHTYTILIVGNRIHWADLLTRALQMGNRIVWACLRTLSALAAFIWVDVRLGISHADRSKRTGVLAGFTHTFTAVIGDCVGRNRALLTGCIDNLYDVVCIAVRRTFTFCQTDSLADNLSLLVYTAAVLCLRTRLILYGISSLPSSN